jgi:hypothetical protein
MEENVVWLLLTPHFIIFRFMRPFATRRVTSTRFEVVSLKSSRMGRMHGKNSISLTVETSQYKEGCG